MAVTIAKFRIDQEPERIRDFQIVPDLEVRAADRHIMDGAIKGRAMERNRSGLQDFVTLANAVVHQRVPLVRKQLSTAISELRMIRKVPKSGKFATLKLSQRMHLFEQLELR